MVIVLVSNLPGKFVFTIWELIIMTSNEFGLCKMAMYLFYNKFNNRYFNSTSTN